MKLFYSDTFELPLPEGHRFPMSKYRLLRERVADSDMMKSCELAIPKAASDAQLTLAHTPEYVRRIQIGDLTDLEIRRIGFPWSEAMVERSRRSVGGSIAASSSALDDGLACNLAGGTHHAFPDSGQGYCVFNDTVVAAKVMQAQDKIGCAMFIDCDVHQGNGTAHMVRQDATLFSLSIHCEKNFPFRKAESDLDVALPPGIRDEPYLEVLNKSLNQAMNRMRPDLAFYLSGADPYEHDRLGQLGLSKQGLAARDKMVLEFCRSRDIPVAVSMAGGYGPIDDIVDIHFATLNAALNCHRRYPIGQVTCPTRQMDQTT